MADIQDALDRWQAIRTKGRTSAVVGFVVVVVVVVAVFLFAGDNKLNVLLAVVAAVVAIVVVGMFLGGRKTGLTMTPEWLAREEEFEDEEFDDDESAEVEAAPVVVRSTAEPIRRLDAQILGGDLTKLGQVVSPKLAKSYAMGDLVLTDDAVAWRPGVAASGQGIEALQAMPAQVTAVERVPLWGSWALLRIEISDGNEWCMRVPNSVDLTSAFSELGLTLQSS